MPFIKLDTGILESTLWIDRAMRDVFITALLMADLHEVQSPQEAFTIGKLEKLGFVVPAGWYGFVHAADSGIIRRALVEHTEGMTALEKLSNPDASSRSPEYEGRRMVRVDGGFIILNYCKYREKDHTNADRQARWRDRHKQTHNGRNAVIVTPVTDADADAYEYLRSKPSSAKAEGKKTMKNGFHGAVRKHIQDCHREVNHIPCPWDGSEAKALDRMLKTNPSWDELMWLTMVSNHFQSEGCNGERPRVWLPHISKWARGPLDRFGHTQKVFKSDELCFRRGCENPARGGSFCSVACEVEHQKRIMRQR